MMRVAGEWLTRAATREVMAALMAEGQAFFVGGCVRNALLGAPVADVDIATDILPETVMRLAHDAGLKAVPTGIEHGTVTVVSDGIGYEVTTYRRDVETDGRRAVVSFSTRMEDDAARRDFTMNALYASAEGEVVDPLGGLDDLQAGRVRFIGSARNRLAEDYLRALRFFRFHAWYGSDGFDPDALDAIARSLDGVAGLSKERVGSEMLRLLAAPDPAPAVAVMAQIGLLGAVLPTAVPDSLAPLVALEGGTCDVACRLASLGGSPEQPFRLSRSMARDIAARRAAAESLAGPAEVSYRFGVEVAWCAVRLRAAMAGMPMDAGVAAAIERGAAAQFPVSAGDLMPALSGVALGERLAVLEASWIESGFTLTRDDLLGLNE